VTPGVDLAILRDGARGAILCVQQPDALVGQRGNQLWYVLLLPVAVGVPVAPPVDLTLLSQRECGGDAGGNGDEPPPRFRQDFDPPGQHLARQRAVAARDPFGSAYLPCRQDPR